MKYTLGKTTRILLLSYLGFLSLAAIFYGGGNYVENRHPTIIFLKTL